MISRRKLHLSCILFNVISSLNPVSLYDKLEWSERERSQFGSTQSLTNPVVTASHGTATFRGCYKYTATYCWNNIPLTIRDRKTLISFKHHYKKHLLT